MSYLDDVDTTTREFADAYDELPLWSAPFGLMLLERVPIRADQAVLDVGAGTGWLALELAERCGPRAQQQRLVTLDAPLNHRATVARARSR